MAGLRTLLDFPDSTGIALDYNTLYVYDSSSSASNGGSCCEFCVPAGTNWFAVEMWGGGGGGAGGCCCRAGWPGGSGAYARKIINGLSGGECFIICAAGSTGCSSDNNRGCEGNPSFVRQEDSGTVCVCAAGGCRGCSRCEFQENCSYNGCAQRSMESGFGCGALCIPGLYGGAKGSAFCQSQHWQMMNSAPFTPSGIRGSSDGCAVGMGPGCCQGPPAFPGGGGATAINCEECCRGQYGASGLVIIYYGVEN